MNRVIYPCASIAAEITISASKSHAQRVLACSLICKGETEIIGIGDSEDEKAAISIVEAAGATIKNNGIHLLVASSGFNPKENLAVNCGESGLSSRMFTPILANSNHFVSINGTGSLLERPMHFFDEISTELKIQFSSNDGKLPFEMQGPLIPKSISIDGSLSSQFVTGLIYGFVGSPLLKDEIITIENPTSIPYIELTLDVLKTFGVHLNFLNNQIQFNGPYTLKPAQIQIEGDWSSASFLLVAGALLGKISIPNVSIDSKQADKAILQALKDFGAHVTLENGITVEKNTFNSFEFDATHCPDLFPPLAVLASFGKGSSKIKGVNRLIHKESNRAEAIATELGKMGAKIRIDGDFMLIDHAEIISGATIDTHHDHRIAMACAIMGLMANSPTTIENSMVVKKSFPHFYEVLKGICG